MALRPYAAAGLPLSCAIGFLKNAAVKGEPVVQRH